MDPVTHTALGAAIGIAVMGRRTALWRAAAWGSVCGTLPDLDVLADYGNPILDMTLHRSESHALVYLSLLAPLLALVVARLNKQVGQFKRWWLMTWLALLSHPSLDAMTVYGTRLGLPITDHPFAVGSIFIIDPLLTLPLLVGAAAALMLRNETGRRWNAVGLALGAAYLAWTFVAQQHVARLARASLQAQGAVVQRLLVVPTPFNSVLWRVLAIAPDGYHEGFHSLLDQGNEIRFDRFERDTALEDALRQNDSVARIAEFSRGFFTVTARGEEVLVRDLRMGQEPNYSFTFLVARRSGAAILPVAPVALTADRDAARILRWIWHRMRGNEIPPPRDIR